MMPAVSVIIPTFNRAQSIVESINSVRRQTFSDFEIIVVDDSSTDRTVELVSAIEDHRIKLIVHEGNSGAGAARNTGIRAAKGTFIAFHDSDDEWLPTKLAKQLAALTTRRDWAGVYCGMLIVKDIHQREGARTRVRYVPNERQVALEGDLVRPLTENSFISTQTLVVRRDVVEVAGQFDESLRALLDWDFALRVARVGKIAFVDEPLVFQRFSPDSLSRSEKNRVDAQVKILAKIRPLLSPEAAINHHYRISGGFRRVGDYEAAMKYIRFCVRARPFSARYWLAASSLLLMNVSAKLRQWIGFRPDHRAL